MTMYKEYNTNQLSLELNLAYDIPMNHEARLISLFVDSIPNHVLLEEKSHTGRPAFHPAMLLKMTLFAYARQVFSGRKIVQMNDEVIPMKWLSQDTYVSYKTINNFRSSKHANNLIKTAFIYFTLLMRENGMIEDDALFIDGTKLEADANLYSFTWKKAINKYEDTLNGKTAELYDTLVQEGVDLALSKEECETSEGLVHLLEDTEQALAAVEKAISEEPKVIKGGSANKQKRRRIKKLRNQLKKDYLPRKQRYEKNRDILKERNSFSKTDHEVNSICLMFALGAFCKHFGERSLDETLEIFDEAWVLMQSSEGQAVIKSMRRVGRSKYNTLGLVTQSVHDAENDDDSTGFGTIFAFKENNEIEDILRHVGLEELAKTEGGNQKHIYYNPTWNYFKELIKEKLTSEEGSRIYAKRKIDVEPVFGRLKSVFGVRRVHVRGRQAIQTEIRFLFMSMNLTKLAKNLALRRLSTQKPHSDSFSLIVFKTEIVVWFHSKASFCPASLFYT